jgi:hypothetical protein
VVDNLLVLFASALIATVWLFLIPLAVYRSSLRALRASRKLGRFASSPVARSILLSMTFLLWSGGTVAFIVVQVIQFLNY